ncbi:MAG: DJ-1/PfpI family protein [Candidatus Marinimicrobia bacterium]|nr:DJ-1/PfpI family protein [Candidatus Neomarinimicrobiota bacterium]MCF7851116.1 DJ-1/PfpI family protein [Candidatus Neomarinimicrobiota bacterium]MCF7904336.1 DJ-1/PfpI family protein [Candidatus Neomarinimicrobiota bacterium]
MKRVLVPMANGFEEIEAITIIDILRRAGAEVCTAALDKKNVEGSHGLKIITDAVLDDMLTENWDMVVLPGGVPGAPNLMADERIITLLKKQAEDNKTSAAICAAPAVLEKAGLTKDQHVTSHPEWADRMTTAIHTGARVETASQIVTGQAAGSAMEFAFKLVEVLFGPEKVAEVNTGVLARL